MEPRTYTAGEWFDDGCIVSVGNNVRRLRVANEIFQFCGRVRDRKRHGDATGAPDGPLDRDVIESRCHEKCDARFAEIIATVEKANRRSGRRAIQIVVRKRPVSVSDCDTCAVSAGTRHDRGEHRKHLYRGIVWPGLGGVCGAGGGNTGRAGCVVPGAG